jgi:Family of unknown function (DUF6525)
MSNYKPSNNGSHVGVTSGSMEDFDKLPKALRAALRDADHNWSGEQLYHAHKRRHPKVRTVKLALDYLKQQDARKHASDTSDPSFGVMPGQREVNS